MRIIPASPDDLPDCRAIYAHHVLNGAGSFEETPPDLPAFIERQRKITAGGLPWLVAKTDDGIVAGYAYAGAFMERSAYRFTVEDSVYVAPDAMGRGVGRALLVPLIERCTELGFRRMIARIGDSANSGSRALHRACGFAEVGILPAVGLKFGRWRDVVMMQRPLGSGDGDIPDRDPDARVIKVG